MVDQVHSGCILRLHHITLHRLGSGSLSSVGEVCWLVVFVFVYPLWLFNPTIFYRWKRFHIIPTDWARKARPFCKMCERLHRDNSTHIYDIKNWFVRDAHCLTKASPRIKSFIGKGYTHFPNVFFLLIIAMIIILSFPVLSICIYICNNELDGTEEEPSRSSKEVEAIFSTKLCHETKPLTDIPS